MPSIEIAPSRSSIASLVVGALRATGRLAAFVAIPVILSAQGPESVVRIPDPDWLRFESPEQAGFSLGGVEGVLDFGRRRGVAAGMIVHDGAVVATWGDVSRRFPIHSIRKSLLSALYGMYPERIDLERTLADLGIDDRVPLSDVEKAARVVDLLSSRSGIYHPAAAEAAEMAEERPERGSRQPGEAWWYNNWDFNAAGTAFERMTGERVLDAFAVRLARPLGMDDYRESHAFESLSEVSVHPAFHLRMSTRDLARFGLLFAREGRWGDHQLIPGDWVRESTTAHSETHLGGSQPPGYGYMWWVESGSGFSARGYGGHVVAVYPAQDLVVVLRADTFHDRFVSNRGIALLLDRVRNARRGRSSPTAELRRLEPEQLIVLPDTPVTPDQLATYSGEYGLEGETVAMKVFGSADSMFIDYGEGAFRLHPMGEHRFLTEDSGDPVVIELDSTGAVRRVLSEPILYRAAASASARGDAEAAVSWVEVATRTFPESPRAHLNLARAYLGTGRADDGVEQLDEALRLDPDFENARSLRRSLRLRRLRAWIPGVLMLLVGAWGIRRIRMRRAE